MLTVKCIQKFRNNHNQIISYRLQDSKGNIFDINTQQLKVEIINEQINVVNLTLTSNNHLINANQTPQLQDYPLLTRNIVQKIDAHKNLKFAYKQNLNNVVAKARILGFLVERLSENIIAIETNTNILLISDKKIHLDNTKNDRGLFEDTTFKSIDFTNTCTSNVTDMHFMFEMCRAESINISSFDTSNVKDMFGMFWNSCIDNIDISGFNVSSVEDMNDMFWGCNLKQLNISNLNIPENAEIIYILDSCQAESILISNDLYNRIYIYDSIRNRTKIV